MGQFSMDADSTLDYYERHVSAFADSTAGVDMSAILSEFALQLPEGATVLDWGCGTGRDSKALCNRGFNIVSTDASPSMCRMAKELFGVDARCESFGDLDEECVYDGIWACASLLHVLIADLPFVIEKARRALKQNGVFYASFKLGDFEGMRGGRWFSDLDERALKELLQPGFDVIRIWTTEDVRPERAGEKWLNSLSRKRS